MRTRQIMRLLALGAALSAGPALAATAAPCTRPLAPPGPVAAPRDQDYAPSAQLELEIYLNEVAEYLMCLKRESDEAAIEARELAERWYAADPLTWR